jgi:hypothetical protein
VSNGINLGACAADWQYKSRQVAINSLTATELTKPDPTRWSIWFSAANSRFFVFPAGADQSLLAPGVGIAGYTFGQGYIKLIFPEDGAIVQAQWFGACSSGTDTMGIVEILYRPAPQ